MRFSRAILFALAGLLIVAGCRPAKVQSYRVPKEVPPPPLSFDMPGMAAAGAPEQASATAAGAPAINAASSGDAALRWVAPESWAALPPVSMRVAGYRLSDAAGASAELTITAFPGDVGGDLANINRWRGQIGLAPIAAEALATEIQRLRFGGREFKVVEMSNPAASPAQAHGALMP